LIFRRNAQGIDRAFPGAPPFASRIERNHRAAVVLQGHGERGSSRHLNLRLRRMVELGGNLPRFNHKRVNGRSIVMTRFLKTSIAAATAAATLALTAAPADAQRWRHRDRDRDRDAALAIGAGILGLGIAASLADNRRGGYYYDDYYYQPRRYYRSGYYPRRDYRSRYYRSRCVTRWHFDPWYGDYVRVRYC